MGVLNFTYQKMHKIFKNKRLRIKLTSKKLLGVFALIVFLRYAIKNDLHHMVWDILKSLFEKEKEEMIRNSIWGPK
jgi:hypothetical protein